MLIDDGYDWFPTAIDWAISEAQYRIIVKYLNADDERVLRPLYRTIEVSSFDSINMVNNLTSIVSTSPESLKMLSIRSVKIKPAEATDDRTYITASHVDYPTYLNYTNRSFGLTGKTMPMTAWYTILHLSDSNGDKKAVINFSKQTNGDKAEVTFIPHPSPFICDTTARPYVLNGLMLPNEVHPEVCLLAAELLNTQDVGEDDRSKGISLSDASSHIEISGGGIL